MVSDKTFSSISVSSDDEDDFVIQAGVRQVLGEQSHESRQPSGEMSEDLESDDVQQTEEFGVQEVENSTVVSSDEKKRDTYQETRLEDLKSTPMPTAQKVTIALALVGVTILAVYILILR